MTDMSPLAAQMSRIIWCAATGVEDPRWTDTAAGVIELLPAVRDGQRALTAEAERRARHFPRPRIAGSLDAVCDRCRTGWPCEDAVEMDAAR